MLSLSNSGFRILKVIMSKMATVNQTTSTFDEVLDEANRRHISDEANWFRKDKDAFKHFEDEFKNNTLLLTFCI